MSKEDNSAKYEPVTWRADRKKIRAIKAWGLFHDRKLQAMLDEALEDFMAKYSIKPIDMDIG